MTTVTVFCQPDNLRPSTGIKYETGTVPTFDPTVYPSDTNTLYNVNSAQKPGYVTASTSKGSTYIDLVVGSQTFKTPTALAGLTIVSAVFQAAIQYVYHGASSAAYHAELRKPSTPWRGDGNTEGPYPSSGYPPEYPQTSVLAASPLVASSQELSTLPNPTGQTTAVPWTSTAAMLSAISNVPGTWNEFWMCTNLQSSGTTEPTTSQYAFMLGGPYTSGVSAANYPAFVITANSSGTPGLYIGDHTHPANLQVKKSDGTLSTITTRMVK